MPVVLLARLEGLGEPLVVALGFYLAREVEVVYATEHVGVIVVAISAQPETYSRRGPRAAILLVGCRLLRGKLLKSLCCYWWLAWLGVRALRAVEGFVADVLLELLL